MPLLSKQDPVELFIQGGLPETKLQKKLKKLTQEEIVLYDTDSWCRFLIELNETYHPMIVSAETKQLIIERLTDDQLVDIAVRTRGNDYVCALAISEMKEQDSLQKVMEYFHRFTPFKIYMWDGEKLVYTDHPFGTPFERGGLAVWMLLQRIDQEHFKQAWYNCGKQSKWVEQLRNKKGSGRYFSGYGLPGWEEKTAMCYQDLLPEVEHRIILAESGVEFKEPFHAQVGQ